MVNDILDLTKAEVGRLDVLDEIVDLPEIIAQATRMVEPQAISAGIELRCHVADDCRIGCCVNHFQSSPRRIAQ